MVNVADLGTVTRCSDWRARLFARLMRGIQTCLGIHVCRVRVRALVADTPRPKLPSAISLRRLDRDDLIRASQDRTLSMSGAFVEAALSRGDVAFGAYDGNRLISYMWRTFTAAPHVDGLWVRVDRPYCYGYKAFTHPDYRGLRVNPALSLYSDAHIQAKGYTHHVGFVAVHNLSSLATNKHKGNRAIGYAGYVKWFGRCLPFRTRRVKQIGFEFFAPRDGCRPDKETS